MTVLMIDNYDSFTYNIVQYLGELGARVTVVRNDDVTVDDLDDRFRRGEYTRLCISPGPCTPAEAGVSVPAIRRMAGRVPILGVCLGHQAVGVAFGGRVIRAREPMHGKTDRVTTDRTGVFAGLPGRFTVTRYHSLVVAPDVTPDGLEITAWSDDGEVMGVRHRELPVEGVQFHPESILTEHGHDLLRNFLEMPT